jgi:competence ComEA-like helix-hairpin-helix protein
MGDMIGLGAKGSDEDMQAIFTYLVTHRGRVNVNKAEAEEIIQVLAIAAPDGQKIVDYRKAHGPFSDFDALAAVPGIDVEKLKPWREAVAF